MRIGLRDDGGRYVADPGVVGFSVPVMLDQDRPGGPCGCGEPSGEVPDTSASTGLPVRTVQERKVQYFDVDGNPQYEWVNVHTGEVIEVSQREELNDATGQTRVLATLVMGWPDGTRAVKEKDRVLDEDGNRWAILSTKPGVGSVGLELEWLDQNG
jgi:hypothetical protein